MIAEIKVNRSTTSPCFLNPPNWVDLYADSLYKFALTKVDSSEAARELVQETFLAGLEKVEKFEGRCSEMTWLCAILKYKAIHVYRKKSRDFISYLEIADGIEDENYNDHIPEEQPESLAYLPKTLWVEQRDKLTEKEFYEALNENLKQMPALWISVFKLRFIEEKTTEFICDTLNITQSNFWVIIHRIRAYLKKRLHHHWS